MSLKLDHSNGFDVQVDAHTLTHQVVNLGAYEFPFSDSEQLFGFFLNILREPGRPQTLKILERCPNGKKRRSVHFRFQPAYPSYPVAIGTARVHLHDLWRLLEYFRYAAIYVRELPSALQELQEMVPHEYRFFSDLSRESAWWFANQLPYVEQHLYTHCFAPGHPGNRYSPREEFLVFQTVFGVRTLLEGRIYQNGQLARLAKDAPLEDMVFCRNSIYGRIAEVPYLLDRFPGEAEEITREDYAKEIGVEPRQIEKERPKFCRGEPFIIQRKDGSAVARCWRCSRLIEVDLRGYQHSVCLCAALNLVGKRGGPRVAEEHLLESVVADVVECC